MYFFLIIFDVFLNVNCQSKKQQTTINLNSLVSFVCTVQSNMNHLSSKQIELNTQNSCYTQVSGTVFSNRANINRLEWDTFLSLYLRSLIASPSLWIRSIPFTPLTLSAFHLIRTRIIANCVARLIDWSIKRENSNGAHSTHASISVFGIFIVFLLRFFFALTISIWAYLCAAIDRMENFIFVGKAVHFIWCRQQGGNPCSLIRCDMRDGIHRIG